MRVCCSIFLMFFFGSTHAQELAGAWRTSVGDEETVLIFSERHYSIASYDPKAKTFLGTQGGSWRLHGKNLILQAEFNTTPPDRIGFEATWKFKLRKDALVLTDPDGNQSAFQRLDAGSPGALAGAWLITGRVTAQGTQSITPGVRKTMKILSGTRFQWIAYNSETKEFLGTGGGTYTTENGRYTETIEFFSRDNTRVGMQLTFDYSLPDGSWRHQGKSSKGEPIDEIWTKRERLGL